MPPKEKKPRLRESVKTKTPEAAACKKHALNFDSDGSDAEGPNAGGGGVELKINEEFAKRFEHNKKREELQRLEEKYKKKRKRDDDDPGDDLDSDSDASTSESEDEFGEFADEVLDVDILETIKAIRSKDPRVYDGQTRFFKPAPGSDEEDEDDEPEKKKKEKPMYLKDYHRENLLNGGVGLEEEEEEVEAPRTYHQQQDALKRDLVMDMHRQAEGLVEKAEAEEDNDDDDFLVTKTKIKRSDKSVGVPPPPAPETADPGDPDSYLTSFLASKAWLPQDRKNIYGPAMESDDSEEEDIAEKFEEGFNLRFEDPTKAAQLVGHARGAIKLMSTRRNEMSARKRARELKKQKKEDERKLREIEKGRLRVLKVEELTKKVKKIREVAGLEGGGGEEDLKDWKKLLDGGFSDEQWDAEMSKKFDDTYYETKEGKMPEKPTWDNDIDVGDIGSDLDVEAGEGEDEEGGDPAITGESSSKPKRKTRKDYEREKREKKQQERKIRKEVEEYVDENFDFEDQLSGGKSGGFRYREVTPETFGLTPVDILAADDTHLNEYVGLKRYATFREKERKKLDKKKYSKKRRLREWRKEVFGDEDGLQLPKFDKKEAEKVEKKIEEATGGAAAAGGVAGEGTKKKRRKRKKGGAKEGAK